MKVYGYSIPAEVDAAAVARMKQRPFCADDITRVFTESVPTDVKPIGGHPCARVSRNEICMRAADRIIQRERKAGNIARQGSREWIWVGGVSQ